MTEYTPETLREKARDFRAEGRDIPADVLDAHADAWEAAVEENERLELCLGGDGKRIERVTPDDEIVASGATFHMERMDDDHIWFRVDGVLFDLHAVRWGLLKQFVRLEWSPQEHGGWAALAAQEKPWANRD